LKHGFWVLKKEVREMLRDRRVVIGGFVMPALMIIMFIGLMGWLEESLTSSAELKMVVYGSEDNPIVSQLRDSERTTLTIANSEEELTEHIASGQAHLGLIIESLGGPKFSIKTVFDSRETLSSVAASGLRKAVAEANTEAVRTILETQGNDPGLAEPIVMETEDIAEESGASGGALAGLLPYLIVIWAFYGGFGTATDIGAGEKERGTLETLLTAPAKRKQIVFGKYLALAVACTISAGASLVGLWIATALGIGGATFAGGLAVTPMAVVLMIAILIPLVLMFSAALLTVSFFAKSVREAQTYLTVASFLVIMPAVMSQFVGLTGADEAAWVVWTPVLNSAVGLTSALKGQPSVMTITAAIVTSGVLAWIFFAAAAALFKREQILNRT
jgi:sodium transport system permease protein